MTEALLIHGYNGQGWCNAYCFYFVAFIPQANYTDLATAYCFYYFA
jgi:hypothetical protein